MVEGAGSFRIAFRFEYFPNSSVWKILRLYTFIVGAQLRTIQEIMGTKAS